MNDRGNWQPAWWNEEKHGSAWERAKEALKRDWEQTKRDFGAGGRELDQDVDDTLKQVVGTDVVPPPNQPNVPGGAPAQTGAAASRRQWSDVEAPMRYGYGARAQYNAEWNDKVEEKLRSEWEEKRDGTNRNAWDDVKAAVRRGYEHVQ
jgi:hypothetical protein